MLTYQKSSLLVYVASIMTPLFLCDMYDNYGISNFSGKYAITKLNQKSAGYDQK